MKVATSSRCPTLRRAGQLDAGVAAVRVSGLRREPLSPTHRWRRVAFALVATATVSLAAAPIEAQATPERRAASHIWLTPAGEENPPVGRVTGGDALVKEKGRFKETWVHPDARLMRYSELYLWNEVFQFRDVRTRKSLRTSSSILLSTGSEEYPVSQESRERFQHVFVDTFVEELQRSKRFQVVDEVGPGTLIVRGGVLDIVSRVPPSTARVDVYLAKVGEATIVFELIDPETGLMQARLGGRRNIQPPRHSHDAFSRPANVHTMWVDVERWASAVASDLRHELEERLRNAETNR